MDASGHALRALAALGAWLWLGVGLAFLAAGAGLALGFDDPSSGSSCTEALRPFLTAFGVAVCASLGALHLGSALAWILRWPVVRYGLVALVFTEAALALLLPLVHAAQPGGDFAAAIAVELGAAFVLCGFGFLLVRAARLPRKR